AALAAHDRAVNPAIALPGFVLSKDPGMILLGDMQRVIDAHLDDVAITGPALLEEILHHRGLAIRRGCREVDSPARGCQARQTFAPQVGAAMPGILVKPDP